MRRTACTLTMLAVCAALAIVVGTPARGADPVAGTPAWVQREWQAFLDGFGRTREQAADPAYGPSVRAEVARLQSFWRDEDAAEFRGRPRITLTRLVTWPNVGDPWRNETRWTGTHRRLYFLNRWGAKIAADLWGPADLFDSDAKHPAVVITDGSIQGNSRMYWWAAQSLAAAGYVVLSYDVQGQGESETFGHHPDGSIWCGPVDQPPDTAPMLRELGPCPGFPFQQPSVFMGGAVWAHNFFLSTPSEPWEYFQDGTATAAFNPWWDRVDADRVGAAGHSFGAAAVSFAQGNPQLLRKPIRAIVAWDRLSVCQAPVPPGEACPPEGLIPVNAPALDLEAEDLLFPTIHMTAPDPGAKLAGLRHWSDGAVDVMSLTLRASTHLEFTAVPALPASARGEDVARYYTLAWFDRYLRDDAAATGRLLAREIHVDHYTPTGSAVPLVLAPADYLSFRYRSGVSTPQRCSLDWVVGTAC